MLNRRNFLAACGLAACGQAGAVPGSRAAPDGNFVWGAMDAAELGLRPGVTDDQSSALARILDRAWRSDIPLFLPPGDYVVSNVVLPPRIRLIGPTGAARLVQGGGGPVLRADDAELVQIDGIVFVGASRWLAEGSDGLLDVRGARQLSVTGCRFLGGGRHALALERVAGRIERNDISGAAFAGIYCVESAGLQITGNVVEDCGNGGILVHRWQPGADGTLVSGNRIARILARDGGTGQNGNGINVFRADNVIVAGNHVSDCAFSAIRANSARNIQISGNSCLSSGETAIYCEFAFEGAVVSANVVDGAANGISLVNLNVGGRLSACSGNLVRNLALQGPYPPDPPGFGVGITVEADCSVTGNVIENASRYGMHLGWGEFMRNVVATGNVIRQAGTGIAVSVVEGTGPAIIADNLIDGARDGAIVGYRWSEPATGDLASPGTKSPPGLTIERNRT